VRLGGAVDWLMVQAHEFLVPQSHQSVGFAGIVAELDFVHAGSPNPDHGSALSTNKPFLRQVL